MAMDLYDTYLGNFLNTVGLEDFLGSNTTKPPKTMRQASDDITGVGQIDPAKLRLLDAQARQAGYRNYEEMALRRKAQGAGARVTTTAPGGAKSWGEALDNALAAHPASLMRRASDALSSARGE